MEFNYRPQSITAKQDSIVQLVAQYVAYSRDPSRYQFLVRERTKHNHNFSFLLEGDKAYDYYRFLLHTHLQRAQMGYHNERFQRDQFSQQYTSQLHQHHQQGHGTALPGYAKSQPQSSGGGRGGHTTREPMLKMHRTEATQSSTANFYAGKHDDDDDGASRVRIVVENGVQRVVSDYY